jgi:hypothetical protein
MIECYSNNESISVRDSVQMENRREQEATHVVIRL